MSESRCTCKYGNLKKLDATLSLELCARQIHTVNPVNTLETCYLSALEPFIAMLGHFHRVLRRKSKEDISSALGHLSLVSPENSCAP